MQPAFLFLLFTYPVKWLLNSRNFQNDRLGWEATGNTKKHNRSNQS